MFVKYFRIFVNYFCTKSAFATAPPTCGKAHNSALRHLRHNQSDTSAERRRRQRASLSVYEHVVQHRIEAFLVIFAKTDRYPGDFPIPVVT